MIDWYLVGTSALWILGLSIVLAAFSYHQWAAGEAGRRLREQLHEPTFRVWWFLGMLLFCVGFGLSENSRWWERALWLALAASFGWQEYWVARQLMPSGRREPGRARDGHELR